MITFVTGYNGILHLTMVNSQEFGKRLQIIMDHYGVSATAFAEKLGINRSTISHLLSGRNKPSLDVVMKVLQTYPEVELYWLLNGTGNFPSTPAPKLTSTKTGLNMSKQVPSQAKAIVPPDSLSNSDKTIDRVVIFFSDGSFKSYQ